MTVQIGTSADAAKDQAAGLAGADEALSVASTLNLAPVTADGSSLTSALSQCEKATRPHG